MALLQAAADILLHLDTHLQTFVQDHGVWAYVLLFVLIFSETGLVLVPFLPGDSLLFAAGAVASQGGLNVFGVFLILCVAAITGDTFNYWAGYWVGPHAFAKTNARLLKKKHLDRTQAFFDRYGAKTIIIARFVPIVRSFAPFVAGIGRMDYWKFIRYNVIGGVIWVVLFVFGGYFLGNLPFFKHNFDRLIIAVVFLSLLPPAIEYAMEHVRAHRSKQAQLPLQDVQHDTIDSSEKHK